MSPWQRTVSPNGPGTGSAARTARRRDAERGSALLMVTAAIAMLMAFAIVAIDGPILMTTKVQLQQAADAAALAGASGLIEGSQNLARDRAIEFAGYNNAVQDSMRAVTIVPGDVTFRFSPAPAGFGGLPDIIRVQTHRTQATGDPLRTYFRRLVDPLDGNTADVVAVAEAQAYNVCGSKCVKPWAIPDRFEDLNTNGVFDAGDTYQAGVTSYMAPQHIGLELTVKNGNPQQAIAPGQFFPVCLPPIDSPFGSPETGADIYRQWIAECAPYTVSAGDRLRTETGNMAGPTAQGVRDLINQDANAYWDAATGTVKGSAFGMSPRIALVPLFDPTQPPGPGSSEVRVTKIGAMFIDRIENGDVIAKFMKLTIPGTPCALGDPSGVGTFTKGITLIQ